MVRIAVIIFPPALLAIPIVGYFWFKAAERFREEMRERMDEMEERRGDDEAY